MIKAILIGIVGGLVAMVFVTLLDKLVGIPKKYYTVVCVLTAGLFAVLGSRILSSVMG
jgi:H+/Cl- antiporter ClcA